jgi:hypothetical protein
MATVTFPEPKIRTLADLLNHLGGIPAERVRLQPTPGTAKEKDILEILQREDLACELIDGVVVEKALGWMESFLAMRLGHFLQSYLDGHDLGVTWIRAATTEALCSGRQPQETLMNPASNHRRGIPRDDFASSGLIHTVFVLPIDEAARLAN